MKIRVEKTNNYTVMCNYHLREKDMSLKAKGLLTLIFSLPDTWDYTIEGLTHITKEGVGSIRAAIKELEQFGYIERKRVRNSNGRLGGAEYIIHEMPVQKTEETEKIPDVEEDAQNDSDEEDNSVEEPKVDFSTSEKPMQENPMQVNAMQENPRQLNTNILNTNILNNNISNQCARRYYPDDNLEKSFRAFIDMRKRINKPLTDNSMRMIRDKLNKLTRSSTGDMDVGKAIQILDYSTMNGYPDIYEPKPESNNGSSMTRDYSAEQMEELEKQLLSN